MENTNEIRLAPCASMRRSEGPTARAITVRKPVAERVTRENRFIFFSLGVRVGVEPSLSGFSEEGSAEDHHSEGGESEVPEGKDGSRDEDGSEGESDEDLQ